jgi:hypothetical protein
MIYVLQLPKPSDNLINLVKSVAFARPINVESQRWHSTIQDSTINCAAGDFFSDDDINTLAKQEFQPLFKHKIFATIGVIHNINSLASASYPPHCDRVRTASINFYIELGGSNVSTIFYDKEDLASDSAGGHVLTYNEVSAEQEYVFDTDTWYLLNSRKFHSVENIKTTRIVFGLSFFNTTTDELLESMVDRIIIEPI